jgi:hypothetical protein
VFGGLIFERVPGVPDDVAATVEGVREMLAVVAVFRHFEKRAWA